MVSNIAWMLSNLCRNRDPPPPRAVIKKLLPYLNRLLQYEGNKNVVVDTAWALSYASDAVNEFIDDIIESGCVPLLLRLLASSSVCSISTFYNGLGESHFSLSQSHW